MQNFIVVIFLILFTSCNNYESPNNKIELQSPIIANDISNQKIIAFAEDELGHLWIGTSRGLNKFDGNEFYQYFSTNDSLDLADNYIKDLMLDSKNRLWVSTVNGVSIYTDKDNFIRIPIKDINQNGHHFIETKDGRILLNFSYMVGIYNPEAKSFDEFIHFDYTKIPLFIFIDASNDLWTLSERSINRHNSTNFEIRDKACNCSIV